MKFVTVEFGGKMKDPHGSLADCTTAAQQRTTAQAMICLMKLIVGFVEISIRREDCEPGPQTVEGEGGEK